MDSNQLLHYLRGFFELVEEPTPAQIRAVRNEVLRARPVVAEIIPVEVANPLKQVATPRTGGCGCGGGCGGGAAPAPYIDREKILS